MYRHGGDTVEQIVAKIPIIDSTVQLAVSGAHHPDLNFGVFLRADAAELSVLQELKQFCLERRLKLRDFIQKKRTAMGQLHPARLGSQSSGKCSSLIAKQFALQQRARDGGTIHFDKGSIRPRRVEMEQTRDDVLARTALACDEY